MKQDPVRPKINLLIKVSLMFKRMQKERMKQFFKCFYDWDRERRMRIRLKVLNLHIMVRIVKKSIHEQSVYGFGKIINKALKIQDKTPI